MFAFFRRYQRAFFLVITGVIIFSFSFFGTYSAFTSQKGDDPVAYTCFDGRKVYRSELNDMQKFISSDIYTLGESHEGVQNPLNDGVLTKDIIETGIGRLLVARFASSFQNELVKKLEREKLFRPYIHPQASFVSAMQVWSYFAPDIKTHLDALLETTSDDPLQIYEKKSRLYLAERSFPSTYLRQILHFQQKQNPYIEPDISLAHRPLSLFTYTQVSDWFGNQFVDLSCEFILQTAAYARKQGIKISSDEVLDSLYSNIDVALQKMRSDQTLTPQEVFQAALTQLHMDKDRVIRLWEDVLLFRRVLLELPNKLILSVEPFKRFYQESAQGRTVDLYSLQAPLRFSSQKDLYGFQAWIGVVAPSHKNLLTLPYEFESVLKVKASFPEFVERKFLIQYAQTSVDEIASKIRLKDIWNFQTDEKNFALLQEKIPLLAEKSTKTYEERKEALESLPSALAREAEQIAIKNIILNSNDLVSQALDDEEMVVQTFGIRSKDGKIPLKGIVDLEGFIKDLSAAPLGVQTEDLSRYTQDGMHFYKIIVIDISKEESLVPYETVLKDGTIQKFLSAAVEAVYPQIRQTDSTKFKDGKGNWKPFSEVSEEAFSIYFRPFLQKLDEKIAECAKKYPQYCHFDDQKTARLAVRFLPHLEEVENRLRNGGDESAFVVRENREEQGDVPTFIETAPLTGLWLLEKNQEKITKKDLETKPQEGCFFEAEKGIFLPPQYLQATGPRFAIVRDVFTGDFEKDVRSCVYMYQAQLGGEAIRQKASSLMPLFFPEEKKA